jgi:hypothetical protein
MADIIQLRGGTAAAWTAKNPILAYKEPAVETDTNKLKMGDGVTDWNTLPYLLTAVDNVVINSSNHLIVHFSDGSSIDAGAVSTTFKFVQSTPTTVWEINHNLNRNPSVIIYDSTGTHNTIEGDVRYIDSNNVQVTFSSGFAGEAYCN